MEFKGQYLTYEEYKGLGGTLDLTPFNILEFQARRMIDIRTQNRIQDDIPQEVKMCTFNLINSIEKYASVSNSKQGNVASESTDGYSVSYVSTTQVKEIIKSKQTELNDIIRESLLGVIYNDQHLLYAGLK